MPRTVKRIFTGQPVIEGAGVHLRRVFGSQEVPLFDPFLMLDDFRSDTPERYVKGFPWHPHRGIETITYVIAGEVEHGDSLGNAGVIGAGDVQWMSAGSGIIHQEMPSGDANGSMHGFQLWANLPAAEKMSAPRYRGITSDEIPVVRRPDNTVLRVIAGEADGVAGPVADVAVQPEYLDCELPPGGRFGHPVAPGRNVFIYVIGGNGETAGQPLENRTLALYEDGDGIEVAAGPDGLRFLLVSGVPLEESVAWRGPIVMNTQEELDLAFREVRDGTFIKHDKPQD